MENDIDSSHTLAIRDMTAALEKQFDPRLTVPLDQSGKIQVELVCRRCLYNLRGLTLDGNCPECNTPVNFSIQKDHLQFSNPAWVNKLRSGSATIFNTTITCIVAIIIIGFPIHALTPSNITVPNVMISGGFLLLFLFASVFQIGV